MNRLLLALPVVFVVLVGPSQGQDKKNFASELYPLQVGNRWVYSGSDGKDKITVTVDKAEPVKRRTKTPTGDRLELIDSFVLRVTNGDKSLQEQVLVTDDGIYRYAAAGKEITPPLKILKLPPAQGESWPCESQSDNVSLKGTFVVEQAMVKVPGLGDVRGWVSSTRDFYLGDQKMEASYWFAPGIGIVKQHVKVGKYDLKLDLAEVKLGAEKPAGLPSIPNLPLPGK